VRNDEIWKGLTPKSRWPAAEISGSAAISSAAAFFAVRGVQCRGADDATAGLANGQLPSNLTLEKYDGFPHSLAQAGPWHY